MAGYYGYSMSNNAVIAYEQGEKPLSKWTKKVILNEINYYILDNNLDLNIEFFSKITLKILRENFLEKSSWHHTSKFYNKTYFYELRCEKIYNLTNDDLLTYIKKLKEYKVSITTYYNTLFSPFGRRGHLSQIERKKTIEFNSKNSALKWLEENGFNNEYSSKNLIKGKAWRNAFLVTPTL